jgi:hypothetical protein
MPAIPAYLKNKQLSSPGTLEAIRDRVAEARDIQFRIADHQQQIKELQERYTELTRVILPDMFSEARVPRLTLDASGNLPRMEAQRTPYYRANIASDWSPERKQEAFRYLESKKAGDLIKMKIVAECARESRAEQKKLLTYLAGLKRVNYSADTSVAWASLTAWLKAEVESGAGMPKLDLIGGDVGQIVKLKEVKDD